MRNRKGRSKGGNEELREVPGRESGRKSLVKGRSLSGDNITIIVTCTEGKIRGGSEECPCC